MSKVTIQSKTFYPASGPSEENSTAIDAFWFVECVIEATDGIRTGSERVALSDNATDEELAACILKSYNL